MTDRLPRADGVLLRINLLLLLVIAFLPFPTKLVAEAIHHSQAERVFVTFYGLTLLTIRLLGAALDAYAKHEHLYTDGGAEVELLFERRALVPVLIAYAVVLGVGLALPTFAVVLYLAVAVYLIVPVREIRRMFSS